MLRHCISRTDLFIFHNSLEGSQTPRRDIDRALTGEDQYVLI